MGGGDTWNPSLTGSPQEILQQPFPPVWGWGPLRQAPGRVSAPGTGAEASPLSKVSGSLCLRGM